MDLDSVADELYGISPDDFIARRKELLTQARQAGDRELARQVGQLRRPTRTGWLVNVLARAEPDEVKALLDLGRSLAQAQQRGSGADLRRLSQERRTAVDALAKRALALGRDHGYEPPEAARQEVAQTLKAALGDPGTAELVRRGQLTQALTYGGFGPTDLTAALAASLPSPTEPAVVHEPAAAPEPATTEQDAEHDAAAEHDRARRAAAAQAASAAWEQARDELTAGEAAAEQATQAADELADRVEQLRSQLHETEEAERVAREAGRATRKRLTELRRAAAVAEQAATDTAAAGAGERPS